MNGLRQLGVTTLILAAAGAAGAQGATADKTQPRHLMQSAPEPRDRASQIINPHLGPRWPNGQLRDGASQIINPPVQQPIEGSASDGRRSLMITRPEREDHRRGDRHWQERRGERPYPRR